MVVAAGFAGTVTDGPLLVAAAVAALVGLIGFLSPCVLPLIPGYVAYVSGVSLADLRESGRRHLGRVVAGSLLFILGFSVMFTAIGASASLIGGFVSENRQLISRIAEPRLPNSTPSATKIAVKPRTNRTAPASIRRGRGCSLPARPAT